VHYHAPCLSSKKERGRGSSRRQPQRFHSPTGLFAWQQDQRIFGKLVRAARASSRDDFIKKWEETDETESLAIGKAQATVWFSGRLDVF
jgi:hypothetical protein